MEEEAMWTPFVTPSGRPMKHVFINEDESILHCELCHKELPYPVTEKGHNTITSMNGHVTSHKKVANRQKKRARAEKEAAEQAGISAELDALIRAHEEEMRAQAEELHRLQVENEELKIAMTNYVIASEAATATAEIVEDYKHEASEWRKRMFDLMGGEE